MKIILKWFAVGLLAFSIALIYTIPAHLVFPYLPSSIHIGKLNGTLWNAQATNILLDNFALSEIRWRIQPLYLLLGQLKTNVTFSHSDMKGNGDIIFAYSSLDVEDMYVSGDATVISPYLSSIGASIDGKFDLTLESLEATYSGPQNAQGQLIVKNTRLTAPTELDLGDIELNLEQQGDTVLATLKNNTPNTLDLRGTANINPEWRYTSSIRIAPTGKTPEPVRQTLTLLGRTDARGAVTVRRNGQFPILDFLPHLQNSSESVDGE